MGKHIEPKCYGCNNLVLILNKNDEVYCACKTEKTYRPLPILTDEYTKWYNSNKGKNIKCWSDFESDYRPLWCPKCSLEALSANIYETNKIACDIVVDNIMKEYKKDKSNMSEIEGVNHPSHYNKGGVECIDAMESAFGVDAVISFCKCNAFKYQWRAGEKNGESYEKDIAKAQWYLNKAMELMKKQPKKVGTLNGSQIIWGDEFANYTYVVCKKDYNPCRNIEFKKGELYQLKTDAYVKYLLLDGCAFHTTQEVLDEYFEYKQ